MRYGKLPFARVHQVFFGIQTAASSIIQPFFFLIDKHRPASFAKNGYLKYYPHKIVFNGRV